MKHGSIVMAIVLLIGLGPIGRGQSVQTNGLEDWRARHHPGISTKVPGETSRELLGAASPHRLDTGFMNGNDSLRLKGPSHHFPNDRSILNGFHRGFGPALARSSPQSQFSVIDTAIVRSTRDTTRHVYSFNGRAKETSDLTQKLIGGLWVDSLRQTTTYNAKGKQTSSLYEYLSNGQWMNGYRYTYTFDANGNTLSREYEDWSNGQWAKTGYSYTYTFDANGNMLTEVTEGWSSGQLVYGDRYTYTYDANGNRLSDLYESWSNGQWVNSYRSTYTYDANGNMLSLLEEQWSNGQWVIYWHMTATYDANRNVLSRLSEYWSNGQWVTSYRNTYTYDANENMTSDLYEYLSNGQWANGYRNTYTYDAQENLTSIWFYGWLNSSWTPRDFSDPLGRQFHLIDSAANVYYLGFGYNYTFIHKLILTGVASQGGNVPATYSLSQNYPNPFNPSTTIRYALPQRADVSLVVFNTLGQQVATLVNGEQGAGNHEVRFDASALSSGVYFYRLQAGTYVETRKLLLLR